MKSLFLVYHGFSEHSGISKKIKAQCEALARKGGSAELCYMEITSDGSQRRRVGDTVIRDYGRGMAAKLLKRIDFSEIVEYIRREEVEMVYIRHDFNASPFTIRLLRQIKALGVRLALEIPTYPYDAEFAQSSFLRRLKLRIDQLFRCRMARYADRVVTFSDCKQIFGRPTIRISNGIDFSTIVPKTQTRDTSHEVHLLAVANIHFWHGFDRAIEGLHHYYAIPRERRVLLRIAGDCAGGLIDQYRNLIARYSLEESISLIGTRSGEALDAEFAWCDMGVASLGRHRNGITTIKTLKNREYAARGIPFVYSEQDSDFDEMPYVMKAPATEAPLDIEALLAFYDSLTITPTSIRSSIEETLSWDKQMEQVVIQLTAQ